VDQAPAGYLEEVNMSEINDGGPAFPVAEDHKVAADLPWTCGMTLRDYFAAKAMQAILSAPDANKKTFTSLIAGVAYQFADAMLKAREAK
jgi:hypothetical protein